MKSRIINHEMWGYDPDKKGNLKNIIGSVKVENAENLDVNELIDSIHTKGVKFKWYFLKHVI
jgi:hypothetical protein